VLYAEDDSALERLSQTQQALHSIGILGSAATETQRRVVFAKLRAGDPQAHRAATEIVELIADLAGVMPAKRLELQGQRPAITVIDRLEFVLQPPPDQSNPWDKSPALP
jgi:ferric-dicitrate binding protein FerR (iron transport regulator)